MGFLQKTFKVRQCEDVFFKNRSRPCLQYQIKRCTAPCVEFINTDDYASDVNLTRLYLDGKADKLLRQLEGDMEKASEELLFEKAADYRDQISALRQVQAQQMIEKGRGTIDVIAAAVSNGQACVHMLYVRQGRILGSRSYYPKTPLAELPSDLLEEFVPQLYLSGGGRPDLPKEILVNAQVTVACCLTMLAWRWCVGLLGDAPRCSLVAMAMHAVGGARQCRSSCALSAPPTSAHCRA